MEPINRHSLENYAERHRADFDLHEPRPELWAVLEKQLHGDSAAPAEPPYMAIAPTPAGPAPVVVAAAGPLAPVAAAPLLRVQKSERWQRYGIAAALLALVVAAGMGEAWKSKHAPAVATQPTEATTVADAALYLGPDANVVAASQGGADVDARLDTAVHGMERYYIAQLTDRKTQLSQLAPDATAEWARELVGLDSSYQQLKRELPRHPQPEVVLTAMNRNLQIRLDILDRQLELHGDSQSAVAGAGPSVNSEYALADSRRMGDNMLRRNGR
jgi:hypothetical protein